MAAVDFPASPAVGQIFTPGGGLPQYVWTGAVWNSYGTSQPKTWMSLAASPPASPVDGDFWWQTDTGLLFVRYNDGTSVQWVVATPAMDLAALDTRYAQGQGTAGCFKLGSGGPTVAAQATVDIPIPQGYPGGWELLLNGIVPVTTAQAPVILFSADGTTFLTANYSWAMNTTTALASPTNVPAGASSSTFIALCNAMGNASGTRMQAKVNIANPPAGVAVPSVTYQTHSYSGAAYQHVVGGGNITAGMTGPPLAIRLLTTSGNLQAGVSWQLNGYK